MLLLWISLQFTAESRLPPNTSSKFIEDSRSRLVLPCTWSPNQVSRLTLRPNLFANRGLAFDFLAISFGSCLHPVPVVRAASTSRGRKVKYTPNGGTIKDGRGGYRGHGIGMLVDTRAYENEPSENDCCCGCCDCCYCNTHS